MLVSNNQAYEQSSCKNLGAFRFNQSYKLSLLLLNLKQSENRVSFLNWETKKSLTYLINTQVYL